MSYTNNTYKNNLESLDSVVNNLRYIFGGIFVSNAGEHYDKQKTNTVLWVLISTVVITIVSKLISRGTSIFVKPTYQKIVLFSLFTIYVLSSKKLFGF